MKYLLCRKNTKIFGRQFSLGVFLQKNFHAVEFEEAALAHLADLVRV